MEGSANITEDVTGYLKLFGLEQFGGSKSYSLGGLAGILQLFCVIIVMKGHNGGGAILDMIRRMVASFPMPTGSSGQKDKPLPNPKPEMESQEMAQAPQTPSSQQSQSPPPPPPEIQESTQVQINSDVNGQNELAQTPMDPVKQPEIEGTNV